jgi:hypothetical protein
MQQLKRKQSALVDEEAGSAIAPYVKPVKNANELPRIAGLSPIRTRNEGRKDMDLSSAKKKLNKSSSVNVYGGFKA